MKQLDGQLSLDLFTTPNNKPDNCPHESSVVDIGGGKSFCEPWQTWTNCREVNHCVYESVRQRG